MRLSLGFFLSICLGGLQFVAVIIVVLSSYLSSERALLEHARDLLSDVAANTIEHSRGFLQPAKGAVDLVTRLAESDIISSEDTVALEKLLFEQLRIAPQFAGVFFGDEAGNFVYVMRTGKEQEPFRSKIIFRSAGTWATSLVWRSADFDIIRSADDPEDRFDPRERPWYIEAKDKQRSIWTDPYIFFSSAKPGITVAAPVVGTGGALQGVVGVDIEIDAISEFLANLRIGDSGRAVILNRNGDVIAHPDPSLIKTETPDGSLRFTSIEEISDPITRSAFGFLKETADVSVKEEISASFAYDGKKYVSTVTPIISDILPWTIGVFAPEDDFIGSIKLNRSQNIVIAVVVAGMTGLIGLSLASHIHQPIRALALRATQISRGKYDVPFPFPRTFSELTRANDTMMEEIARRKKSELEYGRTFDLASRGMAQFSPETGQFTRVNQKFCEIVGYSAQRLLGMTLRQISHPDDEDDLPYLNQAIRGDIEYLRETRYIRPDGEVIWVLLNAIMIHDEDGLPLHAVATVDDITQMKKAEDQIRKLNHDMSHRERLNTMGEMAASMAHELNQPLTAIIQNADAARITAEELKIADGELLEILGDLESQAHRAGDIIRALRNFVRKDEDQKSAFDLADLIRQTLRLVKAEAKENAVRLEEDLGDLPTVIGSHVQIAQVLVNLLRNAIEAIGPTEDKRRRVSVIARHETGQVRVTVCDTGPGVAPDFGLFTQFETTKPDGMGLGLTISRAIIASHDGSLWYERNNSGDGQFVFTLPVGG